MSDKERVLVVLRFVSETCIAALSALADSSTTIQPTGPASEASIDVRLQDFRSLLSLLYHNTTKLGIALKPSSPTYQAAITPAKDLAAHVDALASCACSIDSGVHGRAFVREVRWATEEVVGALASLLKVYSDASEAAADAHGSGASYLMKTGAVHEAIDRARGISVLNRDAVRKRWEIVLGGLIDCAKEVQEIIEDEQEERESEADRNENSLCVQDDDDDWGELGVPAQSPKDSVKASEEELSRLKSAQHLFRLAQALLERVSAVVLGGSDRAVAASCGMLDDLLEPADALLKASDEFVNALYVPQDPSLVSRTLTALTTPISDLHVSLSLLGLTGRPAGAADTEYLVSRMKSLGLERGSAGGDELAKDKKWFDACFVQISKVAGAIISAPTVSAT